MRFLCSDLYGDYDKHQKALEVDVDGLSKQEEGE